PLFFRPKFHRSIFRNGTPRSPGGRRGCCCNGPRWGLPPHRSVFPGHCPARCPLPGRRTPFLPNNRPIPAVVPLSCLNVFYVWSKDLQVPDVLKKVHIVPLR